MDRRTWRKLVYGDNKASSKRRSSILRRDLDREVESCQNYFIKHAILFSETLLEAKDSNLSFAYILTEATKESHKRCAHLLQSENSVCVKMVE